MRILIATLLSLILPQVAFALVDMKNANFSDTWTDLIVESSGYDLRVQRTYNSRTLFNGIFGFGWCSDFETKLSISPEGNIKVSECGGGLDITFRRKGFSKKSLHVTIAKIVKEVKKRNPSLTKKYLANLRKELRAKKFFREELGKQLGFQGKVKSGSYYFADSRKDERIILSKNIYTRYLPDGTFQRFSKKGLLVGMNDKNGNHLKISYKGNYIVRITDNNGKNLNFQYYSNNKKVKKVIGPGGLVVTYSYSGEDLSGVNNAWRNKFSYKYDGLHNLVSIAFPDKSSKQLTYNKDKDWVTSFRDRNGCHESYKYKENAKNPLNHYFSTVVKKCNGKVTNKSTYEFLHRFSAKGKRYLYQAKSIINQNKTDIYYHEVFGKPISVFRNGVTVKYQYNKGGLVSSKIEPTRVASFEYKNSCNKVSNIKTKYYGYQLAKKKKASPKRKLIKTTATKFYYSKSKCNLVTANNSDGQQVKLSYDRNGRISKILDQSKKIVYIKYEKRFGKPSIVTRPGLGSIKVWYKTDGSIKKVDSKEGPSVAAQVASVFNNLLEIISPATSELSI